MNEPINYFNGNLVDNKKEVNNIANNVVSDKKLAFVPTCPDDNAVNRVIVKLIGKVKVI